MKKLSNAEAELKNSISYKKNVYFIWVKLLYSNLAQRNVTI